jgi:hypothetical protein
MALMLSAGMCHAQPSINAPAKPQPTVPPAEAQEDTEAANQTRPVRSGAKNALEAVRNAFIKDVSRRRPSPRRQHVRTRCAA